MAFVLASTALHSGDVEHLRAAVQTELEAHSNRDGKTVSLRTDSAVVYMPANELASDLERWTDGSLFPRFRPPATRTEIRRVS